MDLRQLATFRMVATTLSFTKAAVALNYVQSSVTAQVQALEEELGVTLFDRLGKRVVLTEPGRRLLAYAERLLDLAEEARVAVTACAEPIGTLTISAPESLCTYRLPALLRTFRARFPQVRLLLKPASFDELQRLVAEGILDVAFLLDDPLPSASLITESLIEEPLLLVAAPEHRLAGSGRVTPADLADESALLTEVGCGYRSRFERTLAAAGVHLGTTLEFGSVEAIKQCVMVGMGVAVLPAITVRRELAEGRLAALAWREPGYTLTTQMVWHKDKWLSPALAAFLQVARDVLRDGEHVATADGERTRRGTAGDSGTAPVAARHLFHPYQ